METDVSEISALTGSVWSAQRATTNPHPIWGEFEMLGMAAGWLWPVLLLGGLGAFLDFLVGSNGQERIRDRLTKMWVWFDDVRWDNFGRREATACLKAIGWCCGKRLFSIRRLIFVVIASLILLAYINFLAATGDFELLMDYNAYSVSLILFSMIGLAFSMSLTSKICNVALSLYNYSKIRNFVVFAALLVVTYLIAICWPPLVNVSKLWIIKDVIQRFDPSIVSQVPGFLNDPGNDHVFALFNYVFFGLSINLIDNIRDQSGVNFTGYTIVGTELEPAGYVLVQTYFAECLGYVGNIMRLLLMIGFFLSEYL